MEEGLTHLNTSGEVHMVDVGDRRPTKREATALKSEGFREVSTRCNSEKPRSSNARSQNQMARHFAQ